MRLPEIEHVIQDWAELTIYGFAFRVFPPGAVRLREVGLDPATLHRDYIDEVLARGHRVAGEIDAIKCHCRAVIDGQVRGFGDLRRWPSVVPEATWHAFLLEAREGLGHAYRSAHDVHHGRKAEAAATPIRLLGVG